MKCIGLALLTLLTISPLGKGQDPETATPAEAQQIKTIKVRFAAGELGQGVEFIPDAGKPGSWPGIVVVPDSSGLNDTIRSQARLLAAQGYLVLAIDLYEGRTPSSIEQGEKWMDALPEPDTVRTIEGAISFLQAWMMNPDKVGIVAWGKGGDYALRVAAKEQKLRAVVINYGPFSNDSFILSHITSPILVNVGALDALASTKQISAFINALKTPNSRKNVKVYPGAAHGFEDPRNGNDYKPADAADAQTRMVLFLAKWVKGR